MAAMKRKTTPYFLYSVGLAVAMLLSACAPAPVLEQNPVAHRYQMPARPVARPPLPKGNTPPLNSSTFHAVTPNPVAPAVSVPVAPAPPMMVVASENAAMVTGQQEQEMAKPPKQYVSSPAAQALVKQASTEAARNDLAAAVATLERALRIEPENPDLWLKLGGLYQQQGNTQQAAAMAAKAQYYQEMLH